MADAAVDAWWLGLETSWPPESVVSGPGYGVWRVRRARGGGRRVNALCPTADVDAGLLDPTTTAGVAFASARAAATPEALVQLWRRGGVSLTPKIEAALSGAGWRAVEATVQLCATVERVLDLGAPGPAEVEAVFVEADDVALIDRLWDALDTPPSRRAIMRRAIGVRRVVSARIDSELVSAAFVAVGADGRAHIHALGVLEGARRKGAARTVLKAATAFARDCGVAEVSSYVVKANTPARALFDAAGFAPIADYAYFAPPDADTVAITR